MGPVAQVGCHPFCSIAASVDENHLASATSHDGRHCTCGANRTRANYSDLHDVSPLCSGFSVKAVEPNGEQGRRHVLDSEKDQPFPSRKDEIGAALVERTGNHESPCVEPYAASCREHFE